MAVSESEMEVFIFFLPVPRYALYVLNIVHIMMPVKKINVKK